MLQRVRKHERVCLRLQLLHEGGVLLLGGKPVPQHDGSLRDRDRDRDRDGINIELLAGVTVVVDEVQQLVSHEGLADARGGGVP